MYLGLLHLHLRLSMHYYLDRNPCMSRGFKVPSTLVENLKYFVNHKGKNVLRYEVNRHVEGLSSQQKIAIAAIDKAVGADSWGADSLSRRHVYGMTTSTVPTAGCCKASHQRRRFP
jgi:hypothetical protein